ncbi:hypothetical protein FIBSPDRAFT_1035441 [Athelia psychrophila]|uniref:triacylglycerol lipase n=1 Tax=Athelia psychrophila TaxID=1759441 RepID=A0A166X3L1_9AGAM|nr:hypothetical protein FIBSPDRAFT_1035441 [Fibularhizoctonia sp. CBS 109695]
MRMRIFLSFFSLVSAALGATTVPMPDNDPFYKPPTDPESSAPGTVFSNRSVYAGYKSVSVVQVLYRTTFINGTATATVATILTNPASTGAKLVSFADHEDAVNTICSSSYIYSTNNTRSSLMLGPATNAMLATGATDYDGPNSAFSAGRQEGYALLDGLRAALNYAPAGIKKTDTVGGYCLINKAVDLFCE